MNAIVKDVMSTHVIAVRGNATYKEMASRLREMHVSAFPVVDDGDRVIGMVSESDLLTKVALRGQMPDVLTGMMRGQERAKAAGLTAAELMSAPAVTIAPEDTVAHAARLMYARRVRRLPVVDGTGRLAGIVTRSDVLSVYAKADNQIRRDVLENVIASEFGRDPAAFTVTVSAGIVTLEGTPPTTVAGRGIVHATSHADGVVAVRDRLTYPAEAE